MSDKSKQSQASEAAIATCLYTRETDELEESARADLEVPDPEDGKLPSKKVLGE